MSTTPLVSPASLRADQYVQQQGHTLLVDPRLIDVLGDLPTQVHRSRWPKGSFEIETVLESLLIPENGMVFPNAGLLPVLAQLARRQNLAWDAGTFDRRIARLQAVRPELLPPGLAGFLSHAPRGRIRVGSGVHAALLIARISQAFPQARIVVLASRQDQLRNLEQAWVQLAETEQLSLTEISRPHGGLRLATFLNGEDVAADVAFHEFDLAIVLEARQISHAVADRALSEQGARFRLFGIETADARSAPHESDLMFAAFGPALFDIPAEGMGAALVQTAFVKSHPRPLKPELGIRELVIQGYWLSHVRNRRIARLANWLATGETKMIHARYPEIAPWWQSGDQKPLRTVVIAASLRQAAELLEYLPKTASLATSATETEIRGLAEKKQQRVRERIRHQLGNPLVTDRQKGWSALHTDCVINAAGGAGIPHGPVFAADGEPRRRVLVVDFDDRQHHQLRQWSRERRGAYEERGWYGWEISEEAGRIEAFLKSRRPLMTNTIRKPR